MYIYMYIIFLSEEWCATVASETERELREVFEHVGHATENPFMIKYPFLCCPLPPQFSQRDAEEVISCICMFSRAIILCWMSGNVDVGISHSFAFGAAAKSAACDVLSLRLGTQLRTKTNKFDRPYDAKWLYGAVRVII